MRISIALCTYNGGRFLAEQLDSLLHQQRTPDELVVGDDGSTDDTAAILARFSASAPFPVRVETHSTRLGSTANFDRTLGLCAGDLVALCDQDDVWYPHKLARMESLFSKHPRLLLAASDANRIGVDGEPLGPLWSATRIGLRERRAFREGRGERVLIRRPCLTGATMVLRRELHSLASPIPSTAVHDAWLSLFAAAVGEVGLVEEPLMEYRIHAGQQIGVGSAASVGRARDSRRREPQHFFDIAEWYGELSRRLRAGTCRAKRPGIADRIAAAGMFFAARGRVRTLGRFRRGFEMLTGSAGYLRFGSGPLGLSSAAADFLA